MSKELRQTWDLETIFPGGSMSPELEGYLDKLQADMAGLQKLVMDNEGRSVPDSWRTIIDSIQDMGSRLRQASAFIGCLLAQNVKDNYAQQLNGRRKQLSATFEGILNAVDKQALAIADQDWDDLIKKAGLTEVRFALDERRLHAKDKLPAEQETLASALSVEGYHAWGDLYNSQIVGKMAITIEQDGEQKVVSVGQAANLLNAPEKAVRSLAFQKWEEAWSDNAELCASALNNLSGFRLNLYRARGWDSVLKEPLLINRMSEATLGAMWNAVERSKPRLSEFLGRKGKMLGVAKLGWEDVQAPLGLNDASIPYADGASFVVEQFRKFNPEMADFAWNAITKGWVESEDRSGKRPGAFCTSFPQSKQSRVFMTYSGSFNNVSTLAHELGHAYHGFVLRDSQPLNQRYAMNVAETASTFAEMIVVDAAIKNAKTDSERLSLLESKVQDSVAMFMNIRSRFLFETRFYEKRKKGSLSVAELNELMLEAQMEAYGNSLSSYHPHFWASKLHFYITNVPFYNFPYTFGYLLSSGIYARSLAEGPGFAKRYEALLRDTGKMCVEDLATKHLGVDLTKPDFWESAVQLCLSDVAQFLTLSAE